MNHSTSVTFRTESSLSQLDNPFAAWQNSFPYAPLHQGQMVFWIPSVTEIPFSSWEIHRTHFKWLLSQEQSYPNHLQQGYLAFVDNMALTAIQKVQLLDLPLALLQGNLNSWLLPLLSVSPYFAERKNNQSIVRIMMVGDVFFPYEDSPLLPSGKSLQKALQWLEKRFSVKQRIALQVVEVGSSPKRIDSFTTNGYHKLTTEPEMMLHIKQSWGSMEDYVHAMRKRYRQRYRSARKKAHDLHKRRLTLSEIATHKSKLQPLLDAVTEKSRFLMVPESIDQYILLQQLLGDTFHFYLYQHAGRPIGFSTAIEHNNTLIAHRVGLNYDFNRSHKLYQNMLYDYAELAITQKNCKVHYGRTALEIKSAIGAKPHKTNIVIRHPNFLPNQILGWIVQSITENKWTQRKPFQNQSQESASPLAISQQCCLSHWLSFSFHQVFS